ncbi:MAG: gamma-glutamylcyclotransferase [Candidatus Doudnabacteria bacterium]|nr:gamma-glutamylcyclotransferase [Candidatus Doudnabacteria bacterium]
MYYFAYGSNLNLEHMRRLCGWNFTVIGPAFLKNYELGPDIRGYANVRPSQDKQVYGVLYDINQQSLDALDDFEGYPEVFMRPELEVTDENGKTYRAWAYIEPAHQFGGNFIKEDYLRRVIIGAKENHLPEEWVTFLESFQRP